ncbi:MAG TPA: hypothetical protein PKM20_10125 [Nitrosomonas sp.]|nr:hypothetical protein [Nitrosomonas sp.]
MRGLNENNNGLSRQYFPKNKALTEVTEDEVLKAVERLNHRPRKVLGYRTPHEVFFGVQKTYTKPLGSVALLTDTNRRFSMLLRSSLILFCCAVLAACGNTDRTFLINAETSSPILEVKIPRSSAECSTRELHFTIGQNDEFRVETCDNGQCIKTDPGSLKFVDRSAAVNPNNIKLGFGDATRGPVEPVEGPDDKLWLCREDEGAQECICIPW